ncbi:hypothetical protein BOO94_23600 [Pseudomonas sp. FSL W5-0299]|jgi:hypothetical protein|nr:hypothetical protein AX279_13560 [Pseudomonas sp. J237]OOL35425.1 hypothetical protein BOO94_23600 [Pseudomonas sp. FSL W5-0299]
MFKRKILVWLRDALIGLGCSVLATGFIGIITPGTAPFAIAFCLVVGLILPVLGLVVSFFYD